MSESGSAILPPELVDEVIEQIDHRKFLDAFSLVSRPFVASCQHRLLRALVLRTGDYFRLGSSRYESFPTNSTFTHAYSLFTTSPHLSRYVRDLTICLDMEFDQISVEGVLHSLGELECLSIEGFCAGFYWSQMAPRCFPPLWRTIQLPSIRSFRLSTLHGVPSALISYALASFPHFSIGCIEIEDEYQRSPDPPFLTNGVLLPSATSVEALSVAGQLGEEEICEFMLRDSAQRTLERLCRLNLCVGGIGSIDATRFLRGSRFLSTLTDLQLQWWLAHTSCAPATFHLPLIASLETLALRIDLAFSSVKSPPVWAGLIECALAAVDIPASTPNIQRLRIIICGGGPAVDDNQKWPAPAPWAPFITSHYSQRLPYLRGVRCRVESFLYRSFLAEFVDYIEAMFPGPREVGVLSFEASTQREVW